MRAYVIMFLQISQLFRHRSSSFSVPPRPISAAHKHMAPPLKNRSLFLQHRNPSRHAHSQTNRDSPSQIDWGTPPRALSWPSFSFTHIYVYREKPWLVRTFAYRHPNTHTQTYMASYPAQRPLTWTCCSHSATHKSLGSQRHCWPSVPCWTWLHGNKSL